MGQGLASSPAFDGACRIWKPGPETDFLGGTALLDGDEFFGTPEKAALMKRGYSLWSLLKDNPRYAYYGRLVALSDPAEDTGDIMAALAKLQGVGTCYFYPKAAADRLYDELEARGLSTDRHEHYRGGEAALAASREVLASLRLPDDLSMSVLGPKTPRELVAAAAGLCEACEVMPVPGPVMRGQVIDGVCLVATDREGRAVASASSYMLHHSSSPRAKDAFWGMLATREDRRGEKIALLLGAEAIVHMWARHGARGFMTGIRADNASSHALCTKLGVRDTGWIYAQGIDREVLGSGSVTK